MQFEELPKGAVVGTGSARRKAQLLMLRPDLNVVAHRGNVTTRMIKLERSDTLSGIVLADAGLERLGFAQLKYETFTANQMIPGVNQGILVAQFRREDEEMRDLLRRVAKFSTLSCFLAERACLRLLKADCHSAVGIFSHFEDESLHLAARVMLPDGTECLEAAGESKVGDAEELGIEVGVELLSRGARKILERSDGKNL